MSHSHYFKDVSHLKSIDVYRVIELFKVPAGALDHAAKKILCAGWRGGKDQIKDVREARDSLDRWLEMRGEDDGEIIGIDTAKGEDVGATVTAHTEGGRLVIDDVQYDEKRADIIGQNGNDGEHYDAIEQSENRKFKQMADMLEVPAKVPRRSPDPKPRPAPVVLPDTSAMVDPTGRPKWSDVPEWVKWLGQDRNGVWTGFISRPEARAGRWACTKRFIELNSGDPLIGENWVLTLEERP